MLNFEIMWKKIQTHIANLPPWLTNIYFICTAGFIIWMLAIDDNNVFNLYHKRAELNALLEKKKFFVEQIATTQKALSELSTNPATQEKFAREHYWMKRNNEDVFVIIKK